MIIVEGHRSYQISTRSADRSGELCMHCRPFIRRITGGCNQEQRPSPKPCRLPKIIPGGGVLLHPLEKFVSVSANRSSGWIRRYSEVAKTFCLFIRMSGEATSSPAHIPCCHCCDAQVRWLCPGGHEREPPAKTVTYKCDARWVEVVLRNVFRCPDPRQGCAHVIQSISERECSARTPVSTIVNEDRLTPRAPGRLGQVQIALIAGIAIRKMTTGCGPAPELKYTRPLILAP